MSRPTWQERLFSKATPDENGCWIWRAGSVTPRGYAMFGGPGDISMGAHRWAHIAAIGPIPAGYEVDHLCSVPLCINPAHLEAVTGAENMRRRSERQTHCRNGHERTPDNTYVTPRGGRSCRTCIRAANARQNARRRDARIAARLRTAVTA